MSKSFLITGGAGFIGSHLVRYLLSKTYDEVKAVIIVDCLDYAGSISNIGDALDDPRLEFYKVNIKDKESIANFLERHQVDIVFHLAARSHVDKSISNPTSFMDNNIIGAHSLVDAIKDYYPQLERYKKREFVLVNISTDEVYGDGAKLSSPALETNPLNPSSPYAGSKASVDMIFNAYRTTYKLPILTLRLSNNFGSHQYPEKLIPLTILKMLRAQDVPLYKDGQQIRQWIYVKDTIQVIYNIALSWDRSHSPLYNIAGESKTNLEVVTEIAHLLKELAPEAKNPFMKNSGEDDYLDLITYVEDRQGHDQRYWIADFLLQTTGTRLPIHDFSNNLRETVKWYLKNQEYLYERLQVDSAYQHSDFFKGDYKALNSRSLNSKLQGSRSMGSRSLGSRSPGFRPAGSRPSGSRSNTSRGFTSGSNTSRGFASGSSMKDKKGLSKPFATDKRDRGLTRYSQVDRYDSFKIKKK